MSLTDQEIKSKWEQAVRLHQRLGSLAQRLALSIADWLEESGVTEADIDRLTAASVPAICGRQGGCHSYDRCMAEGLCHYTGSPLLEGYPDGSRDPKSVVLYDAGQQFLRYAKHHNAKQPPDVGKADVNFKWAAKCFSAAKGD